MKAHGVNKLYFALDPEYVPHISPADIAPQDVLHLFPDGLLRSECAWLLCVLGKLGLRLELVNKAIAAYSHFPPDVRVPACLLYTSPSPRD